ncbi:DUF3105 domain-containing protein [Streptomyces sp. P9(2023)]|uniref:DUF3105 domain-containing protein n=1 Tax=Streptomyces sp. P9(2023) TaxID=3064394 RepID=UPI0028F3F1D5|nr:DUF3105 domain-containing protein [Streptomyces sp. P9(2023)]MDT9691883.1 DUF3105 domain-containing protein [Streptomyces sp. P9(2023)]
MGYPGSNDKSAARRARAEELRRAERAREHRRRVTTFAVSAAILAAAVGGVGYLVSTGGDDGQSKAAPIVGERTWSDLGRNHVTGDLTYPMTPPAGGDHDPVWQNCDGDVYPTPIRDENAVHSLEHGAVWVTYTNKATAADVKALGERVTKTPYSLMSPRTDQASPIVLTAWGHQVGVSSASDSRVGAFLDRYAQGPQAPEPGATCSVGNTS